MSAGRSTSGGGPPAARAPSSPRRISRPLLPCFSLPLHDDLAAGRGYRTERPAAPLLPHDADRCAIRRSPTVGAECGPDTNQ
jgi:hypothetical protein